jgi:mannose-6-phosphate isomerase-like protein (cupin superfamily)
MDNKPTITEGIIESYCLGLLNKEESKMVEQQARQDASVKHAIDDFTYSLERYALANAIDPGEEIKKQTLSLMENLRLEEEKNIDNLPLLNKYSDYKNWLHIVKPLLPDQLQKPVFLHLLREDEHMSQILIWTNADVEDEVHDNERESVIVLEGRCRCYLEETVIELGPGGFLEIPLHAHHDVKVLEPVLAVIQREKVA